MTQIQVYEVDVKCKSCMYKKHSERGWCYMFKEYPGPDCKIYKKGGDELNESRKTAAIGKKGYEETA